MIQPPSDKSAYGIAEGAVESPLVIAVEATRFAKEVRGIGRYVRALLPRLLAQRPGLRLVLFVKPRDVAGVAALYADHPATRGRIAVRPIREMQRTRADAFWYPWNVTSQAPRHGPVVVTMHDVAPIACPDLRLRKWRKNWRWRSRYRATAARATLFVVDSAFTADEVHRMLCVPRDRLRVVHLAADDASPPPASDDAAILARLGVKQPFILAVGAGDRRKNIELVERAMPQVVAEYPDMTLVLAGPRTKAQEVANPASWKHTLGYVSEDALFALYRAASCMVMASKYEGFGLPVLEAMQLGTPVICARSSSLPEVGGDAAVWIDPDDDRQLAAAIGRVVTDGRVRDELAQLGQAQASRFTWDKTARATLRAFDEAIAMCAQQAPAVGTSAWRRALDAMRRRTAPGRA